MKYKELFFKTNSTHLTFAIEAKLKQLGYKATELNLNDYLKVTFIKATSKGKIIFYTSSDSPFYKDEKLTSFNDLLAMKNAVELDEDRIPANVLTNLKVDIEDSISNLEHALEVIRRYEKR